MSARWIAALERKRKRGKTLLKMEYSGRNLSEAEWVVKAHLVKKLREDAERAGHQYLVSKIDAKSALVISSKNRVWKGQGVAAIISAASGEKPKTTKKTASQPQQPQPQQPTAAADLTELKQLVRQLLQQLEELD